MVFLPPLLVRPDPELTITGELTARNGVRTAGIAGLVALGGAATAIYGARAFALNRQLYDLQRQGQLADRYTKAVEQLGSNRSSVRIGGIYGLKQAVYADHDYAGIVTHVLNSYLRDHAATSNTASPGNDVQVAIHVLRAIKKATETPILDLHEVNLSGIDLMSMNLVSARLDGADLSGAKLNGANLDGADLRGATMDGATFFQTNVARVQMLRDALTPSQLAQVDGDADIQWSPAEESDSRKLKH